MEKVPPLETNRNELLGHGHVLLRQFYQLQPQRFVYYIGDTKLLLFLLELLSYAAAAAIYVYDDIRNGGKQMRVVQVESRNETIPIDLPTKRRSTVSYTRTKSNFISSIMWMNVVELMAVFIS